jgi:hypothetical protein
MTTLVPSSQKALVKFSEYCNRNYQFFRRNPRMFWMRKLGRFETIRDWMHWLFKHLKTPYEVGDYKHTVFKDIDVDKVVSSLKSESYYLGINLPQDVLQELLNFAYSTPCYGNRDPQFGFYCHEKEQIEASSGKQVRIASYFNSSENCPAVKRMENDPGLLAIAAKFLGAAPLHVGTDLLWSFPVVPTRSEQVREAQVFHYDLDDYRFIKFFFYLTDVDESSGPHVCIRGSHKNKKFTHQLLGTRCAAIEDEKIIETYGAQNVVTICGKAGLGFAEDARCFHKGTTPTDKPRLFFQIEYAVNDYGNIRDF